MKKYLFVISAALVLSGCTFGQKVSNTASEAASDAGTLVNKATGVTDIAIKEAADQKFAIARAKEFYSSLLAQGEDLTSGPCLTDRLTQGWAADLVHSPRTTVDDEFKNRCPSDVAGTSKVVELDLQGNFVRVK